MRLTLDQFLSERLASDPTPLHVALLGYAVLDPEYASIVAIAPLPREVRELAEICRDFPEAVQASGLRGAAGIWAGRAGRGPSLTQRDLASQVDYLRVSELAAIGSFAVVMGFARPLSTPWATPLLEAEFPALAAWAAQAIATKKRSVDAAAAHELRALLAERWGDARGAHDARAAAARALPTSRIRPSSSRPEWERNLELAQPALPDRVA